MKSFLSWKAKRRLVQLGEEEEAIHIIGSPDIDIMKSPHLPPLSEALEHYDIPFQDYGILLFHPVTTEVSNLEEEVNELIDAVDASGRNFIAVYPNCDRGSQIILDAYAARLANHPRVRLFPSLRFEYILVLLQYADFVLGNSSMGIREAPFYGIPTINVGTRQQGRSDNPDILNVPADSAAVLQALEQVAALKAKLDPCAEFGTGNSHERFREVLEAAEVWATSVQKLFCDIPLHHWNRNAA